MNSTGPIITTTVPCPYSLFRVLVHIAAPHEVHDSRQGRLVVDSMQKIPGSSGIFHTVTTHFYAVCCIITGNYALEIILGGTSPESAFVEAGCAATAVDPAQAGGRCVGAGQAGTGVWSRPHAD